MTAVYHSLPEADAGFGPAALTIGNFDGLHAGHRRIMRRVAAVAREHGWKASVLTFDPHPTKVVAPARAPKLLSAPADRVALMAEEGIEQVLILPFTEELSWLSPEQFARDILAARLDARAVLVGDNFRFGHKHAGDTHRLAELGKRYGFTVEAIPAVRMRGRIVSSSGVRDLIVEGRVALAARMLERCYWIEGPVVRGHGVGSKQTVPTLNLAPAAELLPARGVYITRTRDLADRRTWPSVTNVGTRPTFQGDALTIETFLLEPLTGKSPATIRVEFLKRLREERKFETPELLKAQILRDVSRAKAYFRRLDSTGETMSPPRP
jgi:riboflavin kinase / FMN adenylyltransferase